MEVRQQIQNNIIIPLQEFTVLETEKNSPLKAFSAAEKCANKKVPQK